MSSRIFKALTDEAIEHFKMAFAAGRETFWDEEKKKLIHPGEFGVYREGVVRSLIRLFLPDHLEIGSGFIITNSDDISTQCDLIIYDKFSNSIIKSALGQRFYPIEAVVGVGEIKSDIGSASELNKYLNKLAHIKGLRGRVKEPEVKWRNPANADRPYNFETEAFDQIYTFLVCNKFNFKFSADSIKYDPVITDGLKYNLILSIQDGIVVHQYPRPHRAWSPFPAWHGVAFEQYFSESKGNNEHILHFLNYLNMIKLVTVLDTDMALYVYDKAYMPLPEGGFREIS